MALKLRRGTNAQRIVVTPEEGELVYTTDTKKLYVGDGSTVGGVAVDTGGSGITDIVQDTSPQLGGNLDLNGYNIVSTANGNININPDGTGDIVLNGSLTVDENGHIRKSSNIYLLPTGLTVIGKSDLGVDGNLYIVANTYSNVFGAGFTFAQHHNVSDGINFTFYRTRNTGVAPSSVIHNDDIGDIAFIGWDGTQRIGSAVISSYVDGDVSTGIIPGGIKFLIHDKTTVGSTLVETLRLNSNNQVLLNQLGALTGTNITVPNTNTISIGDVRLSQDGLSTANSNANLYITANSSGRIYLDNMAWPNSDGLSGQVLTTNGSGSLSWTTVSGGGSSITYGISAETVVGGANLRLTGSDSSVDNVTLAAGSNITITRTDADTITIAASGGGSFSRSIVSGTTITIADGSTGILNITGGKSYLLMKILVSDPSWVRIYTDSASLIADSSRAEGVDPTPGSGVIAEIITTSISETVLISPGVLGFNNESTPTTNIPVSVKNKTGNGTPIAITVTLTILALE